MTWHTSDQGTGAIVGNISKGEPVCCGRKKPKQTLSQSLMPLVKAVSASIRLSVSSYRMEAYRNRTLASCLGESRLLDSTVSRHERPVAISFWYSITAFPDDDETTSCRFPRALLKHSSATQTRSEFRSARTERLDTEGDFLDLFKDRADKAGDMVTPGFGLG